MSNSSPDQREGNLVTATSLTPEECFLIFDFLAEGTPQSAEAIKTIPYCNKGIQEYYLLDKDQRHNAFRKRLMNSLFAPVLAHAESGFENTAQRLILNDEEGDKVDYELAPALLEVNIDSDFELEKVLAEQAIWTSDLCSLNAAQIWSCEIKRIEKGETNFDLITIPMMEFLSHHLLERQRGTVLDEEILAERVRVFVVEAILERVRFEGVILRGEHIAKAIEETKQGTLDFFQAIKVQTEGIKQD